MHRKNQRRYRNAVLLIVHLSGSKENGVNVQHLAAKMEQEKEKFTARKSALMGKLMKLNLKLT